nr:phage tail tape measure protein [Clostridium beijerinckii]
MVDIYNDNFGENFEDIGEALKAVGEQTGYTGDGLKEITENAIALRDTFGYEVNESVRSASTLMKQFGIDGDQAFNLISQGKQGGLDFSGEMLDSINEYSVQFKKLGLNAEDMFNVFSAGSQEGAFNLDKVGDAVKEFSIRAVDGSKTTQDGFTQLGFDTNALSAKFSQGGDTAKNAFEDVITALSSMKDPLKQSQVGVELFGTQFEDLGINVIESLGNVDGEISQTYDALSSIKNIKYNDIGNAFQGIKRQLQTSILIPISDAVLPRLNDFSNWFKTKMPGVKDTISNVADDFFSIGGSILDKVLPSVSNLGSSIGDLAKTIYDNVAPAFNSIKPDNWNSVGDAIKDIIDRATEVVNFINDNWPTIEPVVYGIIGAITAWQLAIVGVNTWIGITTFATSAWSTIELMIWGIQNATTAWEGAQWLLNVAMDANPIGVVTLAIAGLGFAIYEVVKHFQEICDWAKKAWDWLTKWNDTDAANKEVTVTSYGVNGGSDDTNLNSSVLSFGKNATGTNYWKGGWTTVNEGGRGELINLPNGSQIIPANKTDKLLNSKGSIYIPITIQGNVIGNEDYANYIGAHIVNEIKTVLPNV